MVRRTEQENNQKSTKRDNTMIRRTGPGQTMIYKELGRKLKIEQHEPTKNGVDLTASGRVSCSCSTSCTDCVLLLISCDIS
jgi:hypothetical protein